MKNNNCLFAVLALLFSGCSQGETRYLVDDHYTGPCLILVKPDSHSGKVSSIFINNRLCGVVRNTTEGSFTLVAAQSSQTIDVVPIGKDLEVSDSSRHIFQLTTGYIKDTNCPYSIYNISFFIGTKAAYQLWNNSHSDESDYFKNRGISICTFYQHIK
jgi:hypothetical protein